MNHKSREIALLKKRVDALESELALLKSAQYVPVLPSYVPGTYTPWWQTSTGQPWWETHQTYCQSGSNGMTIASGSCFISKC